MLGQSRINDTFTLFSLYSISLSFREVKEVCMLTNGMGMPVLLALHFTSSYAVAFQIMH